MPNMIITIDKMNVLMVSPLFNLKGAKYSLKNENIKYILNTY